MAEYIEREALIDWLTKPTGFRANCEDCTEIDCLDCIVEEAIRNSPATDVVEVVHGRWEFDGSDFANIWKCSACGNDWFFKYDPRDEGTRVNYCPDCGADMRVGEEEKLESHSKAYVPDKNVGNIIPVNELYDEDGE